MDPKTLFLETARSLRLTACGACSIDFSKLPVQEGDEEIQPMSFLTEGKLENQVVCHIAHTNLATHEVILKNIHRSPLYSGKIHGVGPRYCPSIEDKVMRFADPAESLSTEQDELEGEGLTPISSANDDSPAPREMAA